MTKLILFLVRLYHLSLSPSLGPHICRFTPSCSDYTYQAVAKYGILHGSFLGFKRVLRCHPWHAGGFDPIPHN